MTIPADPGNGILDMMSRELISKKSQGLSGMNDIGLDVTALDNGIYVGSISSGDERIVKQLVVQK